MAHDDRLTVGWIDVEQGVRRIARRWANRDLTGVHPIPRGGCTPGAMVALELHLPVLAEPQPGCLIVDDLIDSGRTMARVANGSGAAGVAALYRKAWSPTLPMDPAPVDVGHAWVVFPWEIEETPGLDAVFRLLQAGGMDTADPEVAAAAEPLVGAIGRMAGTVVRAELAARRSR
jgi:hypothetical protein